MINKFLKKSRYFFLMATGPYVGTSVVFFPERVPDITIQIIGATWVVQGITYAIKLFGNSK